MTVSKIWLLICGIVIARAAKQRIRNLICDIKKTLAKIGMEGALDCDYYRMLNGDPDYAQNFKGAYMVDYSWAEPTAGLLFFGKKIKRDCHLS